MLIGHPDRYTPDQLEDWIRTLVDQSIPENRRLDYKALPGSSNKEWAKDITSLANESGGVLVYGIPEDTQAADRAPVPARPYGMDPDPGFEQALENVYSSAITPLLPDYRIVKIPLSEYPDKVSYLVWTPESWAGPHMVSGYNEHRFYRRGEFRAVLMTERDVEERYRRRLDIRGAAEQFAESGEAWHALASFVEDRPTSTLMVVPHLLISNRISFHEPAMRTWLDGRPLNHYWLPTMYGVSAQWGSSGDREFLEIHRNGTVVAHHYTTGQPHDQDEGYIIAHAAEFGVWREWLSLAGQLYERIHYDGPVTLHAVLHATKKEDELPRYFAPPVPWILPCGGGGRSQDWATLSEERIEVRIETSAADLSLRLDRALRNAADELFCAFGRWEADCFDEEDRLVSRG